MFVKCCFNVRLFVLSFFQTVVNKSLTKFQMKISDKLIRNNNVTPFKGTSSN